MLQFIIELPESTSLKEKRHVVNSLKHRMIRRYKVSAAEVDLHQSLAFAQIGVAVVSNSRKFGESLMQKIISSSKTTMRAGSMILRFFQSSMTSECSENS
jgi:uncharacterized protein YlxP (DUF503 family)